MANTVKDPVCGMEVDPEPLPVSPNTRDRPITSVRWVARKILIKSRRSISVSIKCTANILIYSLRADFRNCRNFGSLDYPLW